MKRILITALDILAAGAALMMAVACVVAEGAPIATRTYLGAVLLWAAWRTCSRTPERTPEPASRPYRCEVCGASGVKLWREYQTFADKTLLRCVECAEADQGKKFEPPGHSIGVLVAAVPNDRGSFWDYTSVPEADVQWWDNLPLRAAAPSGEKGA